MQSNLRNFLLILCIYIFVSARSADASCSQYFKIARGESCSHIVSAYRLTLNSFYEINPGINCHHLRVGDNVCIRNAAAVVERVQTNNCGYSYVVKHGETCYSIANHYKVTLEQLYNLNPSIDCYRLYSGSNVCLRSVQVVEQPQQTYVVRKDNCGTYYLVRSGDSCQKIVADYRLDYRVFYELNPHIDCHRLQVNQQVCLGDVKVVQVVEQPRVVNPNCGGYYVVRQGESCQTICSLYSLPFQTFYELNPRINCNHLSAGYNVCIRRIEIHVPQPQPRVLYETDCAFSYLVQSNDNCHSIVTQFSLSAQTFYDLNSKLDCHKLITGDRVCVKHVTTAVQYQPRVYYRSDCRGTYTVRNGETCQYIMGLYRLNWQTFYDINPNIDCYRLYTGDGVCVQVPPPPEPEPRPGCTRYYVIRSSSDSCYSIAREYRITHQALYQYNPKLDCGHLRVGENVCLENVQVVQQVVEHQRSPCETYYRIRVGDSCQKIATSQSVPLYTLNSYIDCSHIRVGQRFCVRYRS